MGVRVTLDSTVLQDTPRGWNDAEIKSKRGKVLKGLFLTYSSDLEFWGDGFDYINNVMEENYCETITVTIETDDCSDNGIWEVEFNGIIQIPQISKYIVDQNIIVTKIFWILRSIPGGVGRILAIKTWLNITQLKSYDY